MEVGGQLLGRAATATPGHRDFGLNRLPPLERLFLPSGRDFSRWEPLQPTRLRFAVARASSAGRHASVALWTGEVADERPSKALPAVALTILRHL